MGASFAPAQGGPYSAPAAVAVIRELHRAGFVGGSEFLGPIALRLLDRRPAEIAELADELRRQFGLTTASVIVTRAADGGAAIALSETAHRAYLCDRAGSLCGLSNVDDARKIGVGTGNPTAA